MRVGRDVLLLQRCALLALGACSLETEGTGTLAASPGDEVDDARDDDAADDERGLAEGERRDAGNGPRAGDAASFADGGRMDEEPSGRPTGGRDRDCTKAGAFALRVDLDVAWLGTSWVGILPVVAPGSGTLTVHALARFEDDALSKGTVRACGARIPDFEAGPNLFAGELYGTYIPDRAWDQPSMPTWPVSVRSACSEPGCTFALTPLETVLGMRVPRAMGPRPVMNDRDDGAVMPVDDDGDGYLGLTLYTRSAPEQDGRGRPYTQPPLGTLLSRADRLMLAIALRLEVEGQFETCEELTGTLSAGAVDTTALGCTSIGLGGGEVACDPSAVEFLDQNLPAWSVNGARVRGVRTRATDCAGVRAALEP